MENRINDRILLAYLEGQATTNEIEIIRSWLANHPDNQAVLAQTKTYWENSVPAVRLSETDQAYSRYKKKYHPGNADDNVKSIYPGKKKSSAPWRKIAAAIAMLLGLAATFYHFDWLVEIATPNLAKEQIIKQNPRGQKLTTFLPDGSKVILNSLSSIRYEVPFNGRERVVELEGEAFFDVKKNPDQPFKVISNKVTTTALGTSFNVNSKYEGFTEIALVTGKVEVTNEAMKSVILNPGKSALALKDGSLKVEEFDYVRKVGWKDGMLSFTNDRLGTIISKIEDWYGVDVKVPEAYLNEFNYTASYKNKPLEDVLNGISFVLHFEYEIIEDSVHIHFNQNN
ncbi:MAG: FecR domain-containing protein [Cyclobacteriaceae bacterium]